MVKQIRKIGLVIAALGALALGGSARAQARAQPTNPTKPAIVRDAETADGTNEAESTNEAAGSEVPNNDGPGGHADEPGNPSADHQFEGQE
jgi:hypothetical protein